MGISNLPPIGGNPRWGSIVGDISSQLDLKSALDNKLEEIGVDDIPDNLPAGKIQYLAEARTLQIFETNDDELSDDPIRQIDISGGHWILIKLNNSDSLLNTFNSARIINFPENIVINIIVEAEEEDCFFEFADGDIVSGGIENIEIAIGESIELSVVLLNDKRRWIIGQNMTELSL